MRHGMGLAFVVLVLAGSSVEAHFGMFFPMAASTKRGEAVAFIYQWGHPFEHQLFDAPMPEQVTILNPHGKSVDLAPNLIRRTTNGKQTTIYRLHFVPEERGDFVLVLDGSPLWMEEEQEYLQDSI